MMTFPKLPHSNFSRGLLMPVICASLGLTTKFGLAELPAVMGEKAVFAITDDVVAPKPPRFGTNFETPYMSHWNTEPFNNQWWVHPSLSPFDIRLKLVATGGGADFIECLKPNQGAPKIPGAGAGMGWWDVFRDGFFDGADVVVLRYEDGKASVLREGKVKSYKAGPNPESENRLTLAESGPEVREGDEFIIRMVRNDIPAGTTRILENKAAVTSGYQFATPAEEKAFAEAGGKMEMDKDAPPGGGSGSLKVTVPPDANVPIKIGQWLMGNTSADWPRLHDGAKYQLRFQAKQKDMASGEIGVEVASLASEKIVIGTNWKEYTIDFIGAEPQKAAEALRFAIQEPGTFWLDNVVIYEKENTPEGAFYPKIVDTLKEFRPGCLRIWPLQRNVGYGRSLDAGLGPVLGANNDFSEMNGASAGPAVGLHQLLELCAEVGADPWIVTSTLFTLEEQKNLIEYLAGPVDSPYGKKRAEWGHPDPWTDVFDQIFIEFGNETWNNMFGLQGFSGRAAQYGAYGNLVFQAMKSSPSFKADKFQLILNGWTAITSRKNGFGSVAVDHAPEADASDLAYYTGGWDAVGLVKAEDEQMGWFNILTFSYRMLLPRAREFADVMKEIGRERGRPVHYMVYEAGPGYTLPGPGKLNMKEQEEGKSMAQAVNSLDAFMSNLSYGYTEQAFYNFKNGHYWSSHNRNWQEHIVWKAMKMRNQHLQGDLITATPKEMVTVNIPEGEAEIINQSNSADRKVKKFPPVDDVPLVTCYPFKDGNRYSYMFYSRRLDAPTPVRLEVPYDPEAEVEVYTLSSDSPAAHNIESEAVDVKSEKRTDFSKTYEFSLKPYSVVVLVNRAKQ